MKTNKCDNSTIKSIVLIKESDIKSHEPLEIKRKYGKFDRKVFKYNVQKLNDKD